MCHPPRPFDAALFDLDGTLIDSVSLILDSFKHSFEACGFTVPGREQLLRWVGTPLVAHFSHYTADPAMIERLVTCYREHNSGEHDQRIRAFPGVYEVVAAVHRAGLQTGIVTSKNRHGTERGLRLTGLEPFIDVMVPCDEVTHPKPHPEPVRRAIERLGVAPERAIFVGDSLHDLYCGRAAGVKTAAALWGPFTREHLSAGEPDYWLETPRSLWDVLGLDGAGRPRAG